MATVDVPLKRVKFGHTARKDGWWVMPLTTLIVFSSFIVYVTWALLQGDNYWYGNYLSPLYSPELFGGSPHAVFGPWRWAWIPFVKYSPAMLILVFPLAFRMTCYYYRGAYYKAFWADPPACAVGEPRNEYRGEAKWPLLIQNIHRYALYFALLFIVLLSIDVVKGFMFNDPKTGHTTFGIGVGSLVLLMNVVLIGGYTLGCHSFRHLVGGLLRHAVAPSRAQEGLRLRELSQPPSSQVGLVQLGVGCPDRRLHPAVRHGRHRRPEDLLTCPFPKFMSTTSW